MVILRRAESSSSTRVAEAPQTRYHVAQLWPKCLYFQCQASPINSLRLLAQSSLGWRLVHGCFSKLRRESYFFIKGQWHWQVQQSCLSNYVPHISSHVLDDLSQVSKLHDGYNPLFFEFTEQSLLWCQHCWWGTRGNCLPASFRGINLWNNKIVFYKI